MPQVLIEWYQSAVGQWMKTVMNEQFPQTDSDPAQHSQNIKNPYQRPMHINNRMAQQLKQNNIQLLFGSDTPSGSFYA